MFRISSTIAFSPSYAVPNISNSTLNPLESALPQNTRWHYPTHPSQLIHTTRFIGKHAPRGHATSRAQLLRIHLHCREQKIRVISRQILVPYTRFAFAQADSLKSIT